MTRSQDSAAPSHGDRAAECLPSPYLSLALTTRCTFRCAYCPPDGECYGTTDGEFPKDFLHKALSSAHSLGIRKIRLTGGEPLLYTHLEYLLRLAEDGAFEVHVNTNGAILTQHLALLASFGNIRLKVSMDTLSPSEFRLITPTGSLDGVLEGLRGAASAGLVERLGTVVTRLNYRSVSGCIDFCRTLGIGIKILDLYGVPENNALWQDLYVPIASLGLVGKSGRPNEYTRYFGIPVTEMMVDGVAVRIKDSFRGTRYHEVCAICPRFPCQEGLYCLLVTPSLHVVPCRLGAHLFSRFADEAQLTASLAQAIGLYRESTYANLFWSKRTSFYRAKVREYAHRPAE